MLKINKKTIEVWMKDGKLPQPDIHISRKSCYWKKENVMKHLEQFQSKKIIKNETNIQ